MGTITNEHEAFQAVCEYVKQGLSVRAAIAKLNDTYSASSFYRALKKDTNKMADYDFAIQMRADLIFDDILQIADDASEDFQRSRLRVDARKWVLSRMIPKKYGDKIDVTETKPNWNVVGVPVYVDDDDEPETKKSEILNFIFCKENNKPFKEQNPD